VIWLFDYDLTLYGMDEFHVLGSLDQNITRFVMQHLSLAKDAADSLRQEYCVRFGTTLGGLSALHAVTPQEYFDFIHQGDNLKMPRPAVELRAWLQDLPGSCWVFTNARSDWAERGLHAMGIRDCFAGIIALEHLNWVGKPASTVYPLVEQIVQASGRDIVFYDDKLSNLQPARDRGWTTVWLHEGETNSSLECDAMIARLPDLAFRERCRG